MVPTVESIYRWKDDIETSTETLLLLKTEAGQLAALEARLHELHSYQTPEFLVLGVDSGSQRYLSWLHASLEPVEQAAELAEAGRALRVSAHREPRQAASGGGARVGGA